MRLPTPPKKAELGNSWQLEEYPQQNRFDTQILAASI